MKKLRIGFIVIAGLFFFTIGLSSFVRTLYLNPNSSEQWGGLGNGVKFLAEIPSALKKSLSLPEFMVENTNAADGFKKFEEGYSVNKKLLLSYKTEPFKQIFELVDLNNGKVIKKWEPNNEELYDLGYNALNPRKPPKGADLYFLHPFLMNDESLIINTQLTSLLARIDAESNVQWVKTDRRYHHTTEMDPDGNLWVCTLPFESGEYDILPDNHEYYKSRLMDDEITKINPEDGEIIWSKSVLKILLENGYQDLVLDKGQFVSDMIHLNDIQPALTDSEHWQKGDLLVSCRNLSTVFLYRPSTEKIIWLKEGPWDNQHDADFHKDNQIVVFGNDVIREESKFDPEFTTEDLFFNEDRKNNNIYVYNFLTDSVSTPYSRLMEKEKVTTKTSGRCDILPNGDIFIEETANGRIIFGDSITKKMEYVKRVNDNHVSTLFWSRLIN